MTEKSLSPSPNCSLVMERGIFSSLSPFHAHKLTTEDKKQIQSASYLSSNKKLLKTRSPLISIQTPSVNEKSTGLLKPSSQTISNLVKAENQPKADLEIHHLQGTIKSLKLQIESMKQKHASQEAQITDLKASLATKSELLEKALKKSRTLTNINSSLESEKESLNETLRNESERNLLANEQIKCLSSLVVSVLSGMFGGSREGSGLVSRERIRIMGRIGDFVEERLRHVMESLKVDLSVEIAEVNSWVVNGIISQGKCEEVVEVDKELQYILQYLNEDHKKINDLDHFNMRFEQDLKDDTGREYKSAIAVYGFEGESDHDLEFRAGDIIEIIEEYESGWWIGRLNERTGFFPYNFVKII